MKLYTVTVLLLFAIGCGIPTEVKEAIHGNEKTIGEDCQTWKIILNIESEIWGKLYEEHKKTCEKCQDAQAMRQHLLIRSQAHLLRAIKLSEYADK